MGKRKRRAFTKEFKAETVRLVRDSGKSVGAVARELDLTETALREWVRQAEIDAGRGAPGALTTEEREELGRLQREPMDAASNGPEPVHRRARRRRSGA
jgi:transposase-like protein